MLAIVLAMLFLIIAASVVILAQGITCKGINKYIYVLCMIVLVGRACCRLIVRKTKERIATKEGLALKLCSMVKWGTIATYHMLIVYPIVLAECVEELSKIPFTTKEKIAANEYTRETVEDMLADFAAV